ncbi:MAG: hypothetical protein P4M08_07450 [Oligoflexia bacterium]|nr:hypothetical protein [Oligoflexia bacterium]
MKKFFVLILAIAMASTYACSSAPKKAETPATPSPSAPVNAEQKAASPSLKSMSCQKDSDNRTVEIQAKGAGCDVMYTKFGKTHSVASSSAGNGHCEKTLAHMKKKLEASGFHCQ